MRKSFNTLIVFFINKRKYIILFIICCFLFLSPNNDDIKVCLCTIGKEENLYVREYVEHYKKYNIDKIFIYDNNEINGEKFEEVLNDYISTGFVKIVDIRGKLSQQLLAYQDCLNKNKKHFDWLIFYDMDEFIYLKNLNNIKYYLRQPQFKECQAIQLNMYFHTDNNQLYYENKSLVQRFPKKIKTKIGILKTIIRGNITTNIYCPHEINKNLVSCDGFGNFNIKNKGIINTNKTDFEYYYIDHYSYKSTEEFINKLMRGSAMKGYEKEMKYRKISWYFGVNKITKEKIDLIEKMTNLNLSKYRNTLKK